MDVTRRHATSWLSVVILAAVTAACGGPAAEVSDAAGTEAAGEVTAAPASRPAAPVVREVTIPAGTQLRLELASAIATDSSQVEDRVRAPRLEAISVAGRDARPAGTEVTGAVTEVAQSGRVKGVARIAYRFDSLRHDSEGYAIRTATIAHEAEATKQDDAKKIGIGAGVGAAVGAIVGGGSGAAKGAAIGGAGGTGVLLATRGEEIRLGPGARVTTSLREAVTVRVG
jgi:hypothetical protein